MDVHNAAKKILKDLGYEDIDFVFTRKRHYMPHAVYGYNPREATDIILVEGNEPSLARFGLAMLLVHELAHFEFRRENEPHPDEDFTPEFRKKERELIEKLWSLCNDEHSQE